MTAPLKIGLLGGSFDPPHSAHLALACAALEQLGLDELIVLPTGQAWYKTRDLTPAAHRLAMTELAFAQVPKVRVDAREQQRAGPSYTIDTVQEILAENVVCQLFLIIGLDQALAFTHWHRWRELLQLAIICVADRPDTTGGQALSDAQEMTRQLAPLTQSGQLRWLDLAAMPVSATQIRDQFSHSETCLQGLLTPSVAGYISHHHLYTTVQPSIDVHKP